MTDVYLVTPNFNEVQDSVGEGIYKVRIVDSKLDAWAGNDKRPQPLRYINWTLETFNEEEEKNNGRKIFHKTPIEGPGAYKLQAFYKAATGQECKGPFDKTALHGQEIEVTVGPQKDKPEYTEVKSVRPFKI